MASIRAAAVTAVLLLAGSAMAQPMAPGMSMCNVSQVTALLTTNPNVTVFGPIIAGVPNVANVFQSPNGITVLIPSDTAARNLLNALGVPQGVTLQTIMNLPGANALLGNILFAHVIRGQFNSTNLVGMMNASGINTFNPSANLTFAMRPPRGNASAPPSTVNFQASNSNSTVVIPDLTVAGCPMDSFHVIDTVLLPIDPTPLIAAVRAAYPPATANPSPSPSPSPVSTPPVASPPPKSAAPIAVRNVVVLVLAAAVSALAVAW